MTFSRSQIRKGDDVVVVEGAHQGLMGKVESVYQGWREGTNRKLVKVDDGSGKLIEVRLQFVRIDDAPVQMRVLSEGPITEITEDFLPADPPAAAAPPSHADQRIFEIAMRHIPQLVGDSILCSCFKWDQHAEQTWPEHIKEVERLQL